MIETNKQREKRLKAEAPLRAKRAADYARKMAQPDLGPVHAAFVQNLDKALAPVCPHCGGAI